MQHMLVVEKPPVHPRIEQQIYLAEGGSQVRVSLRDFELPAGTYSVVITATNYSPYSAEVEVLPDQTKIFQPALSVDRDAMSRFIEANAENMMSDLRGALERGDTGAFRTKAKVLLEFSGDSFSNIGCCTITRAGFMRRS